MKYFINQFSNLSGRKSDVLANGKTIIACFAIVLGSHSTIAASDISSSSDSNPLLTELVDNEKKNREAKSKPNKFKTWRKARVEKRKFRRYKHNTEDLAAGLAKH